MSYYKQHIFICTNQKKPGKKCCAEAGGQEVVEHIKTRLKQLSLFGPDKIRVSASGCLGRCKLGPCLVIYPQGVWYRYESTADIDAIIDQHLHNGQHVSDLLLPCQSDVTAN